MTERNPSKQAQREQIFKAFGLDAKDLESPTARRYRKIIKMRGDVERKDLAWFKSTLKTWIERLSPKK